MCDALSGFHAFSGCNITSGISGKCMKTFYKELTSNTDFTEVMKKRGELILVTDKIIDACEAVICGIYRYPCTDVTQVRYEMLFKGGESHGILPGNDALTLHI